MQLNNRPSCAIWKEKAKAKRSISGKCLVSSLSKYIFAFNSSKNTLKHAFPTPKNTKLGEKRTPKKHLFERLKFYK